MPQYEIYALFCKSLRETRVTVRYDKHMTNFIVEQVRLHLELVCVTRPTTTDIILLSRRYATLTNPNYREDRGEFLLTLEQKLVFFEEMKEKILTHWLINIGV
jgi:hypothetical protein